MRMLRTDEDERTREFIQGNPVTAQDDVPDASGNIETEGHEPVKTSSIAPEKEDAVGTTDDDSERLSDIDDHEVDRYLHNEEEKALKKIIWEQMNKEYLEEQAAKQAAAANSTTSTSAKSRKERKHKCVEEKKSDPAQTPLEAARQTPKKKGFSSRINYEALEALYSQDDQGSAKKQKVATDPVVDDQKIDSGATGDGEETGAFEDEYYGEYDGYDGDGYEDYSYDDFDFS